MLPRRQASARRARLAHAQPSPLSPRRVIFFALCAVFCVCIYVNYQFFSTAGRRATRTIQQRTGLFQGQGQGQGREHGDVDANTGNMRAGGTTFTPGGWSDELSFETRQVEHIVFMSGCSEKDVVHAEVLAYTARTTGFRRNITHLMYGCSDAAYTEAVKRKLPEHNIRTRAYPDVKGGAYMFGEGHVTTTMHLPLLARWLREDEHVSTLSDDAFVMVVDSEAVFTKKVDIFALFREVEDIDNPRWFGQDAAWYRPNTPPIAHDLLTDILPSGSPALALEDWREYAGTVPFVAELSVFKLLLPDALTFWDKLTDTKRHLALPLAAAHHRLPVGISGVLSVHHYPSRYENWDFADDVKHNPCNESVGKNIELESYPITIRPTNFTLPQWIDGREWSFFVDQLPADLLHCDAWLFKEPTGYLWYLASHTNGYERVPTILRRRHTISVCMASQAYNKALSHYRSRVCPLGFNQNKAIPMEYQGKTWPTAIAQKTGTVMDEAHAIKFGEYKKKDASPTPKPGQLDSDDIHFVFSSTCTPYQDWQSEILASSFARVGQKGKLTRIVSGCSESDLKATLDHGSANPLMRIHVTKNYADRPLPSMDKPDQYTPYNKPFGLRDWVQNANPPVQQSIVVIIDPDFMFLKPFALNSNYRVTKKKDVDSRNTEDHMEVIEGLRQYKPFFVYEGTRDLKDVHDTVADGVAVAQRWSSYLGSAGYEDPNGDNLIVCPECKHVTVEDAKEHYVVGPPYAMTKHDLELMVGDYCNMTVGKRERHRDFWMAEMMGYVLATSKHKIKHTIFDNLAIAGKADDYWDFVDRIDEDFNPCDASSNPLAFAEAPPLLHGCHEYKAKDASGLEWRYYKQHMPEDMFACDSWMLAQPPPSVWTVAKKARDRKALEQAYGLCTSVKIVNRALLDYKSKFCRNGFNRNMKLRLVDPRPNTDLKVGQVHEQWESAAEAIAMK